MLLHNCCPFLKAAGMVVLMLVDVCAPLHEFSVNECIRHAKELIFEYNQHLLELGCDVGTFQVYMSG